MASGRAERWFRSLRFRLTFWNAAVLLLVTVATLFGLRQALQWTMLRELDRFLADDVREVGLLLQAHYPNRAQLVAELNLKARSRRNEGWFVQVYLPDGRLYLANGVGETAPSSPPRPARAKYSVDGLRVVESPVTAGTATGLITRVGADTREIMQDVNRLTRLLMAAGAGVLVAAPLVGYWLAGRAIRPLSAILETTARLNPDALAERLPLSGAGDELDRLSTTINGFLDRLADHLARQREFVANAAHELRSPLAALRGNVEVALQRPRTQEEYRELLGDLADECEALGTLVNQLLLLAETDAGQFRPSAEPVRLDLLTQRCVEMFAGVAEQKGVNLQAEPLAETNVHGPTSRLRQVVLNLLDNAVKFTPSGGHVRVQVQPASPWVELDVSDDGPGIAADHLPHIFDRFFRADRARSREGPVTGNGLGLCICRAIVSAHGGTIHVDSAPGKGTRVRVGLPQFVAVVTPRLPTSEAGLAAR